MDHFDPIPASMPNGRGSDSLTITFTLRFLRVSIQCSAGHQTLGPSSWVASSVVVGRHGGDGDDEVDCGRQRCGDGLVVMYEMRRYVVMW